MRKIIIGVTCGAMLFALSVSTDAQQPKELPRIENLSGTDRLSGFSRSEPFRVAIRELGYKERALPSNIDTRTANATGSLCLRPNCCVSTSILSWSPEETW
jgi:hypothetical protein